jgi:acyl carrier protein
VLAEVAVLAEVTAMITSVIGPDDLVGIEIGLETSFQEDLEVESIEFVGLSEHLMARYGDQVDFVGWMASMELDEIIALTVGDLVEFVVSPR